MLRARPRRPRPALAGADRRRRGARPVEGGQELWPDADEQRCTVHALRNVTAKLPERHHREVKARWWKTFDEEATSAAEARRELEAIVADYRSAYPSAMAVIERDLDALVAHLRWPSEHRKRIRSTDESVKGRASSRAPRVGVSLRCGRGRPPSEAQELGLNPAAQLAPERALRVAPRWRRPRLRRAWCSAFACQSATSCR